MAIFALTKEELSILSDKFNDMCTLCDECRIRKKKRAEEMGGKALPPALPPRERAKAPCENCKRQRASSENDTLALLTARKLLLDLPWKLEDVQIDALMSVCPTDAKGRVGFGHFLALVSEHFRRYMELCEDLEVAWMSHGGAPDLSGGVSANAVMATANRFSLKLSVRQILKSPLDTTINFEQFYTFLSKFGREWAAVGEEERT